MDIAALTAVPDPEHRFTGLPLHVEYINGIDWRLDQDASYRTEANEISTVRAGFEFDFATIPRPLFWLFPPAGDGSNAYGIAATWHDWLYDHKRIGGRDIEREEADDLFYEIMRYTGVGWMVAHTMWCAVRVTGSFFW